MFGQLFLILGLGLVSASASSTVVDCAVGSSLFTINSQSFSPDPPILGQNATLIIDYTVPDSIIVDSGTAKYSFTLNGIPFPATNEDLCTQIPCPQVPGTYTITSSSIWQAGISGKIITKIQWYDTKESLLLCSQTTFRSSTKPTKTNLRSSNSHTSTRGMYVLLSDHFSSRTSLATHYPSFNSSTCIPNPMGKQLIVFEAK